MQHDDRERDDAAGAPGDDDTEHGAQEDAQGAAPERDAQSEQEFETAPSVSQSGGAPDELPSPSVSESPSDDGEASPSNEEPATSADETPPPGVAGPPPQEAEAYPAAPASGAEPSSAAHSVPATQVGESTQCPRCGTENRPGVAFCRNCGQRLVAAGVASTLERPGAPQGSQACPRCGTLNRAGVAFCQNCGANLRASAQPAPGYVPPAASSGAAPGAPAAIAVARESAGGAVLGPLVLLVGAIGIATAWALPFAYGDGSLWERSFGTGTGYGVAFWNGYGAVSGGILDKAYFGFAAAAPILVALLVLLALGGFLRAAPGGLQVIGLLVATLWVIGLMVLFVILEVAGNWSGDLVSVLRVISPAGIIFLLAGLIVLIGCATRFARS